LELNITDKDVKIADKDDKPKRRPKPKAVYTDKNCTLDNLMDTSAVNRAALELLRQLGVKLTKEDKEALSTPKKGSEEALSTPKKENKQASSTPAEIALYKGIAAEKRSGSVHAASEVRARAKVESLYYFNEAKSIDPMLLEASKRFETALEKMKPPSFPSYSSGEQPPSSEGKTIKDAQEAWKRYKTGQDYQKMIQGQEDNVKSALLKKQEELLSYLTECEDFYKEHPPFELYYDDYNLERVGSVNYTFGTIDISFRLDTVPVPRAMKTMEVIIEALKSIDAGLKEANITISQDWSQRVWKGGTFQIDAELVNDRGDVIGGATITLTNPLSGDYEPLSTSKSAIFSRVKIDSITDTLRVKIKRVNGIIINDESDDTNYINVRRLNFNDNDGNSASGLRLPGQGEQGYGRTGNGQNDYALPGADSNSNIEEEADRWVYDSPVCAPYKAA
jgi:hypothetical protein